MIPFKNFSLDVQPPTSETRESATHHGTDLPSVARTPEESPWGEVFSRRLKTQAENRRYIDELYGEQPAVYTNPVIPVIDAKPELSVRDRSSHRVATFIEGLDQPEPWNEERSRDALNSFFKPSSN